MMRARKRLAGAITYDMRNGSLHAGGAPVTAARLRWIPPGSPHWRANGGAW
jgi:hypothetical protein